jgi:hypothetical protein
LDSGNSHSIKSLALQWLLPARDSRRSLVSAAVAAIVVIASAVICGPLLRLVDTGRVGSLSGIQLETAANWVLCGRFGQGTSADASSRAQVNLAEIREADAYDRSVLDLIERGTGSLTAYCAEPAIVMELDETTMMVIDAVALRLAPRMTLREMAGALAISRLVLLGVFAWSLIESGYSLIIASAMTGIAVYLTLLLGGNALYSEYPFILPVVLSGVAVAGWGLRSQRWLPVAAFVLGVWTAFLGNLRSSHYPIGLAIAALFILYSIRLLRSPKITALAALALVSGIVLYEWPLRHGFGQVSTHHSIAHPLVLGIANPPNELSKREGIEWVDSNGQELARRVNPNVTYLGPGYESALFTYYGRLWRSHTADMAQIYVNKMITATRAVFDFLSQRGERPGTVLYWTSKSGRFLVLSGYSIRFLSRLVTLGPVFLMAFIVAVRWSDSLGLGRSWSIAALSMSGVGAFLEAAIILGSVTLWYNAVLVFVTTFVGLLVVEGILAVIGRRLMAGTV